MKKMIKAATMGMVALIGLTSSSAMANCGSCGDEKKSDAQCKGGVCPVMSKSDKCSHPDDAKAAIINTAGLAALIKGKAAVTVLDARSGKYDDGRRIPGAQQLSPTADDKDIEKVLPDKNALIVTYCAGLTCPASKALADHLKKLGYSNVIEYPQGIAGWADAGNTVEQKGK